MNRLKLHITDYYVEVAMKDKKYYFLDINTQRSLDEILLSFVRNPSTNQLWDNLCTQLPVNKWQPDSLRFRVEGLVYAADVLWDQAIETGRKIYGANFNRENLRRLVRTLPLSHYHYVMGSREPQEILRSRHDALEDPETALAKLRNDLRSLGQFIHHAPGGKLSPSEFPGSLAN